MTTFASIGGLPMLVGVHALGAASDKVSKSVGEVLPEPGALFATKFPSVMSIELGSRRGAALSILILCRLSEPLYTFLLWIGLFTTLSSTEYPLNPDVITPEWSDLRDMVFTASFWAYSRDLTGTTVYANVKYLVLYTLVQNF